MVKKMQKSEQSNYDVKLTGLICEAMKTQSLDTDHFCQLLTKWIPLLPGNFNISQDGKDGSTRTSGERDFSLGKKH
jgi:hypothetical protein